MPKAKSPNPRTSKLTGVANREHLKRSGPQKPAQPRLDPTPRPPEQRQVSVPEATLLALESELRSLREHIVWNHPRLLAAYEADGRTAQLIVAASGKHFGETFEGTVLHPAFPGYRQFEYRTDLPKAAFVVFSHELAFNKLTGREQTGPG